MKNINKYIIATLCSVVILSSCEDFFETTIDLELPEFEEQLVVSAIIQDSEENGLLLSKTVGINEKLDSSILKGGRAYITADDGSQYEYQFIEEYLFNFFLENVELNEGSTYTLNVENEDNSLSATAIATKPKSAKVVNVTFDEEVLDFDGDLASSINLFIQDDPEADDFYKVELYYQEEGEQEPYKIYSIYTNDPTITNGTNYESLIFSDDSFQGQEYKVSILTDRFFTQDPNTKLFYKITTTTEDQYRYDRLLKTNNDNDGNPFNSPVQLHSNIEGGLGIFAIESSKMDIVER